MLPPALCGVDREQNAGRKPAPFRLDLNGPVVFLHSVRDALAAVAVIALVFLGGLRQAVLPGKLSRSQQFSTAMYKKQFRGFIVTKICQRSKQCGEAHRYCWPERSEMP